MEPVIRDKDLVMIDHAKQQPINSLPIAFRLEGQLYVKNCQHTGNGRLEMLSVNPTYKPILINPKALPDDFAIIGAVVWHAHSWV